MATIRTMADLERELNKILLSSMTAIGSKVEKELKESVQTEVYDKYIPKYYKRTGDLKRSVTKEIKQNRNGTSAKIYHDISQITQIAPTPTHTMGKHHSTVKKYQPQKYAFFVPVTIDEGTSGDIFGDGAWRRPRRYFSKVDARWQRSFRKELRDQLTKKGLKVR